MPVHANVPNPFAEARLGAVSQPRDFDWITELALPQKVESAREPHNPRDILRPGATTFFVVPTANERDNLGALANEERAATLRTIDLVRRDGQQVDVPGMNIDGDLAQCLN